MNFKTPAEHSLADWIARDLPGEPVFPEFEKILQTPRIAMVHIQAADLLAVPGGRRVRPLAWLAAAAALVLVSSGAFWAWQNTQKQSERAAIVLDVTGDARQRDASNKESPLTKGSRLAAASQILTGLDGRVDLSLPAGVLVRVGANSQFRLQSAADQKDNRIRTFLDQGKVFGMVEKLDPADGFEVITPTAIAGVRGTRFSVQTDGQSTQVHLVMGKLAVQPQDYAGSPAAVPPVDGEYILDQYDRNWFQNNNQGQVQEYKQFTQRDFSDARELDALARNVQHQLENDPGETLDVASQERLQAARQARRSQYNVIELRNGQSLRGLVVAQTGEEIFVETEEKSLVISARDVLEIRFE
ncbi:MAG: FecR domain-containing protein [Leptospiraceae bacterium]|nr:FecR domain-containing protein [Leptospiraceae bacterium]